MKTRMHSSCVPAAHWPYAAVFFPGGVPWSRGGFSLVPGGSAWSGGFSLVPGGGSPWSRGGGRLPGPGGGSPWSRGGGLPGPGGGGSPEQNHRHVKNKPMCCVECVSSSLGSSGDHYQVHISLIPIMSSPLISTRLCLHKRVYKMYPFASLSKLVFFEGFDPKFHLAINKIFSRLTRCKRNVMASLVYWSGNLRMRLVCLKSKYLLPPIFGI